MSKEYLTFFKGLPKVNKIQIFSKANYYAYRETSLFSLATIDCGDIMAMGNPSKERDIWKGKCEDIERKLSNFQKEMAAFQEKVSCVEAF